MSTTATSSALNGNAAVGYDRRPSISALFLIKFDQKIGYVLSWKRTVGDIPLEGSVEFKSLPSGLHAVKSDLVYFVHEGYAGLSAFVNGPASEAERNAHFVAAGLLVPLSNGRLGRSWLHAHSLQQMASALARDPSDMTPLEDFWKQYGSGSESSGDESPSKDGAQDSSSGSKKRPGHAHSRARALSSITAVLPSEHTLPSFHPALSILKYIDLFGPLVFRLQEAALLRKRILFMTTAPVRPACEYVYNLSVLSSVPTSVMDLLPPGTEDLHRIKTLFTVGIHDIPELEKRQKPANSNSPAHASPGWVACTTDEIIASKPKLYDIIVEIPPAYDVTPVKRRWPTIKTSEGSPVKATQRDLWRYKLLRHELHKYREEPDLPNSDEEEDTAQLLQSVQAEEEKDDSIDVVYDEKVVEPMTWSQLAYSGFMWWASAGEKDAYITQEQERDRALLGDLSDFFPPDDRHEDEDDERPPSHKVEAALHTSIIAYCHRWTSSMVNHLSEIIETYEDEEHDEDEPVRITSDDISRLGFDTWSKADGQFIEDFAFMYFGKQVEVHGRHLDCCGVRIC